MKIGSFARIIQGHQITDEEIYIGKGGQIPIFTGKNEIKGFWNKQIIEEKDLPCITYPSKANTGELYVQTKIFDANNTAVLLISDEWKDKINLQWLCLKLRNLFLKNMTSKEGVSYLNKEIVEELEIEIPEKSIQDKEYVGFKYFLELKTQLEFALKKIEKIKKAPLTIQYSQYQEKNVPVNRVLQCISGNSGLTEEYIYSLLLDKREKKYKVLTGSTDVQSVQSIAQCERPHNQEKLINILAGEGIHIVRKGDAGFCTYLPNNHYTLNDDAYILILQKEQPFRLSLKWLVNTQAELFTRYSSKSDNATWNMTGFFDEGAIDIPSYEDQCKIVEKFDQLEMYALKINNLNLKIEQVLAREPT